MSSYNFTSPTKPNYFINLLVKGYIFPAVLIATILASILGVSFQNDLFSQLTGNDAKTYFIAFLIFFIAILTVYVCLSLKNTEVGINDSVSVGYVFAGIFYFIYLIGYGKGFQYIDLTNIIITLSLIIFGVVLTLLSSLYFKYEDKEEFFTKECYFLATSKRFNFISIIMTAIVINFIFFIPLKIKEGSCLVPNDSFTQFKSLIVEKEIFLILIIIGLLSLVLYAIFSLKESKINALDLFLWGYLFNLPMLIALVCLIGDDNIINFLIVIFVSIVVIAFAILRNNNYKKESVESENSTFFKNLFELKNLFLSIGLTALLVMFINLVKKSEIIDLFVENKKVYIGLVPFVITYIACLVGFIYIGFGLIRVAYNFKKPLFDKNDNLVLFNVAFGIFELLALLCVETTIVDVIIILSYTIISFDVALLRRSEIK